MKAHIITVYDSLNYGSYFQAKALEWEIGKYLDVDFVDIHHQNNNLTVLKKCLKSIKARAWKSAYLEYKKLKLFSRAKKNFAVVDIKEAGKMQSDLYWFGSDEIWNVYRPKIKKSKEFFGFGFPDRYRIAIAPSINRTNYPQLAELPYVSEELKKFYAISVRDKHTKEVIDKLLSDDVKLVSDPTLMHKKDVYKKIQIDTDHHDYILLYTYGDMFQPGVKEKITTFAREQSLKIISVGAHFDFADVNTVVSPEEFLGIVDAAKYVFTDTYHGLMFSLIYEKQFVVFPCGNTKVEDTLSIFQLNDRLCAREQKLDSVTGEPLNYGVIGARLEQHAGKTIDFIKDAIHGIREEI